MSLRKYPPLVMLTDCRSIAVFSLDEMRLVIGNVLVHSAKFYINVWYRYVANK